jgi:hypothetical protein
MHRSPFPLAGNLCLSSGRRGPSWENVLHLFCAMGEKHALQGQGAEGRQGAYDFLAAPQIALRVVWWSRVTLCEHITSRVSRGVGEGGRGWGEGMREQDSGVQIPTEIL